MIWSGAMIKVWNQELKVRVDLEDTHERLAEIRTESLRKKWVTRGEHVRVVGLNVPYRAK